MAAPGHASLEHARPGQPVAADGQLVEYEAFIEQKLRTTRSHVRSVDISAGIMILLAGTLGYFLFAGLVDHWLIGGGLGFWGRLVLLAVFLVAATWWIATQIAPLLFKRINPLYAAQAIEQSRPTLKNTLLNFLFFRANPAGVHARVLEAIEEQAATNLARVQVESAVDRTRLIRLGYVLVGILVVWALYMVLSPKDLIKTVRRVAMPWADISPPTRTVIDEITPGDAQAFRGQQVKVQARVGGLPGDGKVILYYTTADRQIVDRAVAMSRPSDDHRHVAVLPAGDSALQQTLTYRIEAGDAVTREYTIEVSAAPTIVVRAVAYKYPDYTGLLAVRVEHQGDIKAIEGTQVTLDALANQDIASAHVDFDCNDTLDLRMRPDKQTAVAAFDLALREDRRTPQHGSYQVIFKNAAGQQNPQPLRHQIEVTRDIGPEIQFVAPKKDDIDLPLDAAVELEVVAGDPDFALAQVNLSAAKGEAKLVDEALLREPWRGQFVKKFRFQPLKLGLKPGDVVDYWAVAVDNKTPAPNRTETTRRRIRIVSPSSRQGEKDRVAQNNKRDEEQGEPQGDARPGGDDQQPRDQQSEPDAAKSADGKQPDENSQPGEPQPAGKDNQQGKDSAQGQATQESPDGAGDSGQAQQGDKSADASDDAQGEQGSQQGVPNDGTNDGEAIERILKHRQQQNPQENRQPNEQQPQDSAAKPSSDEHGQQGSKDQPNQDSSKSQQSPGSSAEQKDQPQGQQRDGSQKSGGQKEPAADQSGEEKSGQSGQQPGQPQDKNAAKAGDNGEGGDQKAGEKPQPGQAKGQKESSGSKDRQSSNEKGQGQPGKQQNGESKPSSDQSDVERTRGEGKQGQRRPDDAQSKQPGQGDPRQGATQDNNTREDGTPQKPTQGQGGQSQDDPTRQGDQKPQQDNQQSPDAKGGDGQQQKGESGAGKQSPDKQGSPGAQGANKPRNKSQQPGPDEQDAKRDDSAQSPSNSKQESDSQGQQEGDRSGGGKKGGGQKANKPGTGGAGQNTSADEGAGKSDEAGDGETSDRAGGDRQADGKSGQSGSDSGDGSKAKSSSGENEKPGGDNGPQNPSDAQSPSGEQNNPGPGGQGDGSPGATQPGSNTPQGKQWKPGVDQADPANLEYASKATDLALEHLRDQLKKGQPDQELLDRLGWSRQDLEKFVKRWEAMRGKTSAPGDQGTAARRELDETLRSLGLRPRATTLKSNAGRDDRSQGYQESHRTTPPPEFIESFKAYTQGTARGGK